jgi:hypothetical protein
LIILLVAADPCPGAADPGAMACISRNCAPHGPHLRTKTQQIDPWCLVAGIDTSTGVPTIFRGAAGMRIIHVKVSIGVRPQPCLRRLWGIYVSDTRCLGTQVIDICRHWDCWKAQASERRTGQSLSQKPRCRLLQVDTIKSRVTRPCTYPPCMTVCDSLFVYDI